MLLLPSSGSKTTMYCPLYVSSTATGTSSSSEAMIAVRPDSLSAAQKTSLLSTSSFFWSSPCTFAAPARPVMLLMPARCTRLAMVLQAVAMEDSTTTISPSMSPAISLFSR